MQIHYYRIRIHEKCIIFWIILLIFGAISGCQSLVPGSNDHTELTIYTPFQRVQPSEVSRQTKQTPYPGTGGAQECYERGVLHARQGNLTGALMFFDQGLQYDPGNVTMRMARFEVLYYLGRYPEALTAIEEVIMLDPDYADAWGDKASVLLRLGTYAEALTAAEQATTLDPDDAVIWNMKAIALVNLERYNEALTAAEVATTKDPNYAGAWNTKGWILANNGNYAGAIDSFDRALAIDPGFEKAKENKAEALKKLKKEE